MVPLTGYVALLDVLGFSSLVSGPSSAAELQSYLDAIQQAINEKAGVPVQFVLFSDSIVISTKEDSDTALKMLLRACSRAYGLLLERRIAVRGAIAHGTYFREQTGTGVFVAGRPIVDAYEFEKKQKWVGILITRTVLQHKPDFASLCAMRLDDQLPETYAHRLPWILMAQPARIPFHSSGEPSPYDGYAVVPTVDGPEVNEHFAYLEKCCQSLTYMKSLAPDPAAQRKYDVTLEWLRSLQRDWKRLFAAHGSCGPHVVYY